MAPPKTGPVGNGKPCKRCLDQIAWSVQLTGNFAYRSQCRDGRTRKWKLNLCSICMEELEQQVELFIQKFVTEGDQPEPVIVNSN